MNKIRESKLLLQKALNALPTDFSMNEARFHLKKTILHLEQTELKKNMLEQHKNIAKTTQEISSTPIAIMKDKEQFNDWIGSINNLIELEEKKIEEIQSQKKKILDDGKTLFNG